MLAQPSLQLDVLSNPANRGGNQIPFDMRVHNHYCHYELHNIKSRNNFVLFHYLLLISFKSCIFIYHMVNALK